MNVQNSDSGYDPYNEDTGPELDTIQEELVSYLDGELDSQSSAQLERRLAEDPDYRRRLQDLQQAWDLLDELPRAEVEQSFTQSTIEMVAVNAAEDVEQLEARSRRSRSLWWMLGAAAVLMAVLLGYFLAMLVFTHEDRQLVADLPLIQNLDAYRHADSLQFLRALDEEGLFAEETDAAQPLPVVHRDADERRELLAEMPPIEREQLSQKKQRFDELSDEAQQRLRKLQQQLAVAPHSARLHQVLLRYNEWLRTLPSGQRAEVLSLPPERRIVTVKKVMSEQEQQRMRRLADMQLQTRDIEAIFAWLDEFVARNEEAILNEIPVEKFAWPERLQKDPVRRRLALWATYVRHVDEDVIVPSPEDIEVLSERLTSPDARRALAEQPDPKRKFDLAREWMRAAVFAKMRDRRPVSEEELREYYKQLSPRQQEILESYSGERMRRELEQMYYFDASDRGNRERHHRGPRRRPGTPFPKDHHRHGDDCDPEKCR